MHTPLHLVFDECVKDGGGVVNRFVKDGMSLIELSKTLSSWTYCLDEVASLPLALTPPDYSCVYLGLVFSRHPLASWSRLAKSPSSVGDLLALVCFGVMIILCALSQHSR